MSDYWKSGTWDIIEVPAFLNIYNDSHPTETDITFYITIRRKTLFYTVNLILPTVLISFLCVLVFYLPAEAGEKVISKSATLLGRELQSKLFNGYASHQQTRMGQSLSCKRLCNFIANQNCRGPEWHKIFPYDQ